MTSLVIYNNSILEISFFMKSVYIMSLSNDLNLDSLGFLL